MGPFRATRDVSHSVWTGGRQLATITPVYSRGERMMSRLQRPSGRVAATLGTSIALGLLAASPAAAVAGGTAAAAGTYPFLAAFTVGTPQDGGRACTGALVTPKLVLTAKSCFSAPAGTPDSPQQATTVTFAGGRTAQAISLTKDSDKDLALLGLSRPVIGITPAVLAASAPTVAESLTIAGYGRTATEWLPDSAYAANFDVQTVAGGTIGIDSVQASLCKGDAGAPVLRTSGGAVQIAAVAGASWQKGCMGVTQTRSGAVAATTHDSSLRAVVATPRTVDRFNQLTLTPTDSGSPAVAGAQFGGAVASGDFNKDGISDVAVGSPADVVKGAPSGSVTVFYGSTNGPGIGHRLIQADSGAGDEAGDRFGAALAAGDFNKDGVTDLAVGVPGEAIGTTARAGAIAVYNGVAGTGLGKSKGYNQGDLTWGSEVDDQFGSALAAADFNGDGITDLAASVPNEAAAGTTAHAGSVMVIKGATTGLAYGWVVDQTDVGGANEQGDRFGTSIAAGNVTGTAVADLVVGAPGEAPGDFPASGGVYVVPMGGAPGAPKGFGITQNGNGGANEAGDLFGAAVAVGNFDGATATDKYADIAIGSPGEKPGSSAQSGSVTVIHGAATVGTAINLVAVSVTDPVIGATGDRFGAALAAGDVNGDGRSELLVGMPGRANGAGLAILYKGQARTSTSQTSLAAMHVIHQSDVFGTDEARDGFGTAVGFGDLNKDGKLDAIIGAPGEAMPGEAAAGAVVTLSSLGDVTAS
jgi:hypothetical protein